MRIIVFFDLPTETAKNRKDYTRFRKMLINDGFIMLQESVYTKLALNTTASNLVMNKIRKEVPKEGLVQALTITEKQFSSVETLIGAPKSITIDSTERLVIL